MSKCERKVVRKFALETEKSMHNLCPLDKANEVAQGKKHLVQGGSEPLGLQAIPNGVEIIWSPKEPSISYPISSQL